MSKQSLAWLIPRKNRVTRIVRIMMPTGTNLLDKIPVLSEAQTPIFSLISFWMPNNSVKQYLRRTLAQQFSTSAWFIGYLCLIYSLICTKTKDMKLQGRILEFWGVGTINVFVETIKCIRCTLENNTFFDHGSIFKDSTKYYLLENFASPYFL